MTVYGVITAAVVRKVRALVAEIRALVAEATKVEQKIVTDAKDDALFIIAEARRRERLVLQAAEKEVTTLKNELVDKISKL